MILTFSGGALAREVGVGDNLRLFGELFLRGRKLLI